MPPVFMRPVFLGAAWNVYIAHHSLTHQIKQAFYGFTQRASNLYRRMRGQPEVEKIARDADSLNTILSRAFQDKIQSYEKMGRPYQHAQHVLKGLLALQDFQRFLTTEDWTSILLEVLPTLPDIIKQRAFTELVTLEKLHLSPATILSWLLPSAPEVVPMSDEVAEDQSNHLQQRKTILSRLENDPKEAVPMSDDEITASARNVIDANTHSIQQRNQGFGLWTSAHLP